MEFKKKDKCPQCNSDNIEEIAGDMLCIDCGHSFSGEDEEE